MEIILLQDVKSLGKKGERVKITMVMQEILCFQRSLELKQQQRI